MARLRNAVMWAVLLTCGAIVGLLLIPGELAINVVARCLGAKDVRVSEVGFVLRQFTNLRFLRERYPLRDPQAPKGGEVADG